MELDLEKYKKIELSKYKKLPDLTKYKDESKTGLPQMKASINTLSEQLQAVKKIVVNSKPIEKIIIPVPQNTPEYLQEFKNGITSLEEKLDTLEKKIKSVARSSGNGGGIRKIVAGNNVTVDESYIGYPVISVEGGAATVKDTFGITVDGAGVSLTTGIKGYRYIEQDCTITGWSVVSDVSGSIVFDVKRAGVSLAGSEKPTLSAAASASNLSLSTWTTSLVAGDIIEFIIDSASTVTRATLTVLITKI